MCICLHVGMDMIVTILIVMTVRVLPRDVAPTRIRDLVHAVEMVATVTVAPSIAVVTGVTIPTTTVDIRILKREDVTQANGVDVTITATTQGQTTLTNAPPVDTVTTTIQMIIDRVNDILEDREPMTIDRHGNTDNAPAHVLDLRSRVTPGGSPEIRGRRRRRIRRSGVTRKIAMIKMTMANPRFRKK